MEPLATQLRRAKWPVFSSKADRLKWILDHLIDIDNEYQADDGSVYPDYLSSFVNDVRKELGRDGE